jgi:hypothetical protein
LLQFVRQNDDPELAFRATVELLNRGMGKPTESVIANIHTNMLVGGIDRPPRESLEDWLARRRKELAALGPPQPLESVTVRDAPTQPLPQRDKPRDVSSEQPPLRPEASIATRAVEAVLGGDDHGGDVLDFEQREWVQRR